MSTPAPYLTAIRAARARANAIDVVTARQIDAALRVWADELAGVLATLPADRQLAAAASVESVRRTAADLEQRIATAIAQGSAVTFEDTLTIWQQAAARVAESAIHDAMLGAVTVPDLTIAQAFASAQATSTFRSLIRTQVVNAAQEVASITHNALLRDVSPDTLARALKPYVTGRDRLPDAIAPEIEALPADTRAAAYSTEYNAKRIAFSETHNARREAEVAHFQADPHIALAKWTLSPNRGTQRTPDVCDALAKLDWYGLGAGVFPLERVPVSPHPWDRCEVIPITFTPALRKQLAEMKVLRLRLNPATVPLPGEAFMTPRAALRARVILAQIINGSPVMLAA